MDVSSAKGFAFCVKRGRVRKSVVRPSTTQKGKSVVGTDREAVIKAIRGARTRAGLTQEQAAALRPRRATSTISRWETGGMPITWDELIEYAYALNEPITLRFGPDTTKEAPPWAEPLVADVTAIRRGVESEAIGLAALRALLEAIQEQQEPPDDDSVDDPAPAPTARRRAQ
jgi:transcriptional regulator with XRE-family HTH domain